MSTMPSHSAVAVGDERLAHEVAGESGSLKRTLKLRHLVFIGLAGKFQEWMSLEAEPSIWISFVLSMFLLAQVMRKG